MRASQPRSEHATSLAELKAGAKMSLDVTVPDRLSEWLRLALRDAAALNRRRDVEFDMGCWVMGNGSGGCMICLAGAVMLRHMPTELRQEMQQPLGPGEFGSSRDLHPSQCNSQPQLPDKLLAINAVREGNMEDGVRLFYGNPSAELTLWRKLHAVGLAPSDACMLSLPYYDDELIESMRDRIAGLASIGL